MIASVNPLNVPAALLDQLDVGICLIDQAGRVATVNAEFKRQAREYDVFNALRRGQLSLSSASEQEDLEMHIRASLRSCGQNDHGGQQTVLIPSKSGKTLVSVGIAPVLEPETDNYDGFSGVVLISRDETHPMQIDLDLVKRAYIDLTGAELKVIDLLVFGLTNAEIAEKRCRAVETVNSQVKSVLEKTQVSNRTQLVHLLGRFMRPGAPLHTSEGKAPFLFRKAS